MSCELTESERVDRTVACVAMPSPSSHLPELLEWASRGDMEAFSTWFKLAFPILERRAAALGCGADSADVAMEAVMEVMRTLDRWKRSADPTGLGWALFQTWRRMLMLKRRETRRQKLLPRINCGGEVPDRASNQPGPAEIAAAREELGMMRSAAARTRAQRSNPRGERRLREVIEVLQPA